MILFNKLDRYILKYFFITLFVVTIAIGVMIVVINLIELLGKFMDNNVPVEQIVEYYLYFSGWVVKLFVPVFILLASLFCLSSFAKNNEILAMKASGLSLYRITAPILIIVLMLSAGHFYYNEYIFPPANKRLVEIKEFDIKKRSKRRYNQVVNLTRQISPESYYTISLFYVSKREGTDFKLYAYQESSLKELIIADKISYNNHKWYALNGFIRTYKDSISQTFTKFDSLHLKQIKDIPKDFSKRVGKPEDMGLDELREYITLMKRTGGPYIRESIDVQIKYAYPFASFIVVLISIPFAINSRKGGTAVSFSIGALIALVYFVLFKVLQSAGYNEKVPDYVAVWGVNALFFVIGLFGLIRARK